MNVVNGGAFRVENGVGAEQVNFQQLSVSRTNLFVIIEFLILPDLQGDSLDTRDPPVVTCLFPAVVRVRNDNIHQDTIQRRGCVQYWDAFPHSEVLSFSYRGWLMLSAQHSVCSRD